MGFLRLYLAFTVCVNHYWDLPFYRHDTYFGVGSPLAVEIFFIISGFYMALVLGDKYTGEKAARRFYRARVLRLYPTYLAILLSYLLLSLSISLVRSRWLFIGPFVDAFRQGTLSFKIYAVVSNLFFAGQDLSQFLSFCPDKGTLCLAGPHPGWIALFIPQAWSIEVEFAFYLLAPFLVRVRTKRLVPLVLAILAVKLFVNSIPVVNDSWYFRVPPLELGLFLLGVLSCRLYRKLAGLKIPKAVQFAGFAAFMACLAFSRHAPDSVWKLAVLYLLAFACIPFAFMAFRTNRLDRLIGELSYPVYLLHQMVIQYVMFFLGTEHAMEISLVLTFVLAAVIHHGLLAPVEAFRRRGVTFSRAGVTEPVVFSTYPMSVLDQNQGEKQ